MHYIRHYQQYLFLIASSITYFYLYSYDFTDPAVVDTSLYIFQSATGGTSGTLTIPPSITRATQYSFRVDGTEVGRLSESDLDSSFSYQVHYSQINGLRFISKHLANYKAFQFPYSNYVLTSCLDILDVRLNVLTC